MSKYYFLETVLVKGNLKVKALPGQKLKDGKRSLFRRYNIYLNFS